jgi:sugar phosphate isomerase/epimerase
MRYGVCNWIFVDEDRAATRAFLVLKTATQAIELDMEVGAPSVGILLDAYHLSVEEAGLASTMLEAGAPLF